MTPGPRIGVLAAALFAAVALAACGQQQRAGGSGPAASKPLLTAAQASLHTQVDQLLDGGVEAFEARLAGLRGVPVSYSHYYDKDASIARTFGGGRSWPTTAFFAASGKLTFTHIGSYATEAKLDEDITRYAPHG